MMRSLRILWLLAGAALLTACGGSDNSPPVLAPGPLPQLSAAIPASLAADCTTLTSVPGAPASLQVTVATTVPAGTLSAAVTGEHCRVVGKINERVSPIDGNTYAIGFEMRLPRNWNGRFFYQANGGTDGAIVTATGGIGGRGVTETALSRGFAVMSSDAGHSPQTPYFGLDPQARLDYGYNAVAQLTPLARQIIRAAYGKPPDRSYLGGCSNGGRHALVAASRYADQYDGILAGNPGFNLPKSALASIWGVQNFARVATGTVTETVSTPSGTSTAVLPDIGTAFTPAEMTLVSGKVLERCDTLDGAADGIVGDTRACQAAFDLQRDVPTCAGARNGSCLTGAQKTALAAVFAGPRNTAGQALYNTFPFDAGIHGSDWRGWKFGNSINVNLAGGVPAFIHSTPPVTNTATYAPITFITNFNFDTDAPKFFASNATYTESAMSFLTPPNPTDLSSLKTRGAKLMVFHGVSDAIFSFDDTRTWYEGLTARHEGDATNFARLYAVPQMNHCGGGPSTDQFDMLAPLVAWVEQGSSPGAVIAAARAANTERPAAWSPARTRPLCPWPLVARYKGSGSLEDAASFACEK